MTESTISTQLAQGQYAAILISPEAAPLIQDCLDLLVRPDSDSSERRNSLTAEQPNLIVATAALNAFLQANVTGPVLADQASIEDAFLTAFRVAANDSTASLRQLRSKCLDSLSVDGVAPYVHIPLLEVFALAKHIFSSALKWVHDSDPKIRAELEWKCLRIHVWHYKLLTQPSLGSTAFTKTSQWCDAPSLQERIVSETEALSRAIFSSSLGWTREDKIEFLLEKAASSVILGLDVTAKSALKQAEALSGFAYTLSGALGKRTKWQEKSISQMVVLAKSGAVTPFDNSLNGNREPRPEALLLNDDTLLEEIEFNKDENSFSDSKSEIPQSLQNLVSKASEQPQLAPYDQIILLTDATIRDSFSPVDSLTAEEVLPFASRVIADKSTNWQIYTHALLVRSRIEVHRSRTVERGVLQMQAVVDQIVADTTPNRLSHKLEVSDSVIPAIDISTDSSSEPKSFLPAPKPSESAPAQDRLRYIHCLFSPPKWHLESELAYAWASVGSLVSALEIFKRLRMWAEVALCLASAGASANEDEEGRGGGGEEKARAILRWQLYECSLTTPDENQVIELEDSFKVDNLKASDFQGPERNPLPSNAARLFCILGEIEDKPNHFERAWEVSKHRYARAQKALGEYYLQRRDWESARIAYALATGVNRLSPELWGRLGDINLRLGRFSDAAESFSRAIGASSDAIGGEDARTWSNLGSALWSLCCEVIEETQKNRKKSLEEGDLKDLSSSSPILDEENIGNEAILTKNTRSLKYDRDPTKLLAQSLAAYKRGAQIANTNWRIWDNVITLASRMRPPAYTDMIYGMRQIIKVRNTESAVDIDILRVLVRDLVLSREPENKEGKYSPPRGSKEKAVIDLIEDEIVPLITTRDDLWELVSRERVWRRDYISSVEASEKAWRAAMATGAVGVGVGASLAAPSNGIVKARAEDSEAKPRGPWTEDKDSWEVVVQRTDELVSILENYGSKVDTIGTRWKGKARMAIRSVMGKGREMWEGSDGWKILEKVQEEIKV